jgi:hypothetical protein
MGVRSSNLTYFFFLIYILYLFHCTAPLLPLHCYCLMLFLLVWYLFVNSVVKQNGLVTDCVEFGSCTRDHALSLWYLAWALENRHPETSLQCKHKLSLGPVPVILILTELYSNRKRDEPNKKLRQQIITYFPFTTHFIRHGPHGRHRFQ